MASTNQIEAANALLQGLNSKMICAIDYTLGYATKAAFFEHCSKAITEAKTDIVLSSLYVDNHATRHSPLATRHSGYCLSTGFI
jgi:hypothetical protein